MPKVYNHAEKTEWSYLVDAEDITAEPRTYTFTADERQKIDLCRRLNLLSIESIEANVTVQQVGGGTIHAMGTIAADVVQGCVISLSPVPAHIEDEFEGWFGDKARAVSFAKARSDREAKKAHTEIEILEESIDPEPIINGKVDLGELATQYLSLSLDPYPHAEGVAYEFGPPEKEGKGDEGAELRKSPFEALKDWKEKR